MRYIWIILTLLSMTGCGSSGTQATDSSMEKPVSPATKDSSKSPPEIPTI